MARLTWQNVRAPEFRDALLAQRAAITAFQEAATGINSGLGQIHDGRVDRESAVARMRAAGITSREEWDRAIKSGAIGGGGAYLNEEALDFFQNRRGELITEQNDIDANSRANEAHPYDIALTQAQTRNYNSTSDRRDLLAPLEVEAAEINNEGGRLANEGTEIGNAGAQLALDFNTFMDPMRRARAKEEDVRAGDTHTDYLLDRSISLQAPKAALNVLRQTQNLELAREEILSQNLPPRVQEAYLAEVNRQAAQHPELVNTSSFAKATVAQNPAMIAAQNQLETDALEEMVAVSQSPALGSYLRAINTVGTDVVSQESAGEAITKTLTNIEGLDVENSQRQVMGFYNQMRREYPNAPDVVILDAIRGGLEEGYALWDDGVIIGRDKVRDVLAPWKDPNALKDFQGIKQQADATARFRELHRNKLASIAEKLEQAHDDGDKVAIQKWQAAMRQEFADYNKNKPTLTVPKSMRVRNPPPGTPPLVNAQGLTPFGSSHLHDVP